MTDLIKFLHDHHTSTEHSASGSVAARRRLAQGGSTDQQKADAAYMRLIKRLYDGDVTLVNCGIIRTRRPITARSNSTSRPESPRRRCYRSRRSAARVMREGLWKHHRAGKVADIIIVNGKPAQRGRHRRSNGNSWGPGVYREGAPQRRLGVRNETSRFRAGI